MSRIVARRQHAARRRDLDDIGTLADEPPHDLAHLVGAVDSGVGQAGHPREDVLLDARRQPAVAVAARLADHPQAELDARTADQALVSRLPDAEVGATGVPHRGDPGVERARHVPRRIEDPIGERLLRQAPQVDVGDPDVHMAVEQPGQDRAAGDLDRLVAIEAAADVDDAAILDDQVAGRRIAATAVEDRAALEKGPRHRPPPVGRG